MYTVTSVYHYPEGEPYNAGRGAHASFVDVSEAFAMFRRIVARNEPFAVTITDNVGGEIVDSHGDMAAALASSARAYRLRYPPTKPKKVRVIVIVRGGLVAGALSSSADIDLDVLDRDNEGAGMDADQQAHHDALSLEAESEQLYAIY